MPSGGAGILNKVSPAAMGGNGVAGEQSKVPRWEHTGSSLGTQSRLAYDEGMKQELEEKVAIEIEWKKHGLGLELKKFVL